MALGRCAWAGLSLIALGWMVGCGPGAATPPAPLRTICGSDDPIQLVAIEANETIDGAPTPAGDRWLVTVREDDDARIVSFDACGDARVVASHASLVSRVDPNGNDDGVWLACNETLGEVLSFDPAGDREPVSLGRIAADWWSDQTPHYTCRNLVVADDVVVMPRPREPAADAGTTEAVSIVAVPLDEGIPGARELAVGTWVTQGPTQSRPDGVFVRDKDMIVAVEIATGAREEVTVVDPADDVRVLDQRFVVLDSREAGVRVRDRQTGLERALSVPPSEPYEGWVESLGFSSRMVRLGNAGATAMLWLPHMELQLIEGRWHHVLPFGEGVLAGSDLGEDGWAVAVVDRPGADPRPLVTGVDNRWRRSADGTAVVVADRPFTPRPLDGMPPLETRTNLLSVPLDGSMPTTLVHDVFDPRPLTTGEWATVRGFDGTGVGSLVLVDDAGEALGVIDDGVVPLLSSWIAPTESLVESDGVVYFVEDEERHGLWYAEPELP